MSLVDVRNEWDPLEEVIVGTAIGARIPQGDKGLHAIRYSSLEGIGDIPAGPHAPRIIAEAEEDLERFVEVLRSIGIVVRRPAATHDHSKVFGSPAWRSDGMYSFCPRDVLLAIGTTIIESPMSLRSRLYEVNAYKDLMVEYLNSGSRWLSAPKPALLDEMYNTSDESASALRELEPVFDAANCLRAGSDIIYLVSDTGNRLGAKWLQATLGDGYRVWPCDNLYASTHIDTTLCLLNQGMVLVNPTRVTPANLPRMLSDWEVIQAPEPIDVGFEGIAYGSAWISMNLFMLSPTLAVVEERQKPLIALLERRGIDCIPLRWRHGRTLGGGFHCVTLDVRRTSVG